MCYVKNGEICQLKSFNPHQPAQSWAVWHESSMFEQIGMHTNIHVRQWTLNDKKTNFRVFKLHQNVLVHWHTPSLCVSVNTLLTVFITLKTTNWILSNPLLHRYSFWRINNRLLLKTWCEREKLLMTSNFPFSHNVFYSIR